MLLPQITQLSLKWNPGLPNSKTCLCPFSTAREEELGLRITCTQMPLTWEHVTGPSQMSSMLSHVKEKEPWVE